MGCASSAPGAIVEQGKKLASTVSDAATDTVHNATETMSSGVDNVQNSVRIALKGAEETIENAVGKIGETFNITSNKAEENGNNMLETANKEKDELLNNLTDNLNNEATSETETIPASDVENMKEAFATKNSAFFETVHSVEDDINDDLDDMKHESSDLITKSREKFEEMKKSVEDLTNGFKEEANNTVQNGLDTLDDFQKESEEVINDTKKNFEDLSLGETVKKIKREVEELEMTEHEGKTKKAEESPSTFWEQAADAILLRKAIKQLEQPLQDRIFFTPLVNRTEETRNKQNFDDCELVILENSED